jgi:hypothetical protein
MADTNARVRERITVEVDDMVRFLNELHREIERGQYDQAMRSIRQQLAIVKEAVGRLER